MVVALLLLALPLASGWRLAAWALGPHSSRTLALSLGAGLGLGLASWTWFLWAVLVGPTRPGLAFAEIVLFGPLILLPSRRRRILSPTDSPGDPSPSRVSWEVRLAFLFVLLCGVFVSAWYLGQRGYGETDSWAIWNLRARAMYRGGEQWTAAFNSAIDWTHPDYPLLVPGGIARAWYHAGAEDRFAPRCLAVLFLLATVGLLSAGVTRLRTPTQGLLAGTVLLAAPYFLDLAATQYADVPLAFFFLACALVWEMYDRHPAPRLLVLAGVLAALAAWTKNEGQLYAVVTIVARVGRPDFRTSLRTLAWFGASLVLASLPLLWFKLRLAPPNDLVSGQGRSATLGRLITFERYTKIAGYLVRELARWGWGLLAVLGIYRVLVGHAPGESRPGTHTVRVLFLMLVGYGFVYLTTPRDLDFQLHYSLERLLAQVWPLALVAFFLRTAAPEEYGAAASRG